MNRFIQEIAPLLPEIAARGAEFEAQGFISADVAKSLAPFGLYRLCNETRHGGRDATPRDYAELTEYIARHESAVAWTVFIGITSAMSASNFTPATTDALFENRDDIITGVFAPRGKAVATEQNGETGYRISGRWAWGSGSNNAQTILAGVFIADDDGNLVMTKDGRPDHRIVAMPRKDVTLHDVWHVSGLKGTGSTDFSVDGIFVPQSHICDAAQTTRPEGAIYRVPSFCFLGLGVAAVGLGIARAAIDALTDLATAKTPESSRRTLAERPTTQIRVAKAEAALRAARSLYYGEIEKVWEAAKAGQVELEARAGLRLAMTHAVEVCAELVADMYRLGGGSSVYLINPLQRHLRDINTVTQHIMVGEGTYELVGRNLLGLKLNAGMV